MTDAAAAFGRLYGPVRGQQAANAVIPGVMADFRKVLQKALPGAPRREEYALDDGKAKLVLEGHREVQGKEEILRVTSLSVNGEDIPLRDILTGAPGIRI